MQEPSRTLCPDRPKKNVWYRLDPNRVTVSRMRTLVYGTVRQAVMIWCQKGYVYWIFLGSMSTIVELSVSLPFECWSSHFLCLRPSQKKFERDRKRGEHQRVSNGKTSTQQASKQTLPTPITRDHDDSY